MRRTRLALTMAAALLLFLGTAAHGGLLPYDTVQQMCFKADLIVVGTDLGDGKVCVVQVLYGDPRPAWVVKVPSIPQHAKTDALSNDPPIATDRLVIFLKAQGNGSYEPIDLYEEGSEGLFWYDDFTCYGYRQIISPGPYMLEQGAGPEWEQILNFVDGVNIVGDRIPNGKAAMLRAVKTGLALRKKWEAVQAIADKGARASAMAAYPFPRTAPKGYEPDTLRLREEIGPLGPDAVPALVKVLETAQPDENLNEVCLTLYDIGSVNGGAPAIRPAVPLLCRLLRRPGPAAIYYILSPLTVAADPRAIPDVRPFLKDKDKQILEDKDKQILGQAALALAAMNDQESFAPIAAWLEAANDPRERMSSTLSLAQALFKLDPARARPIIEQAERIKGNEDLHLSIAGWR